MRNGDYCAETFSPFGLEYVKAEGGLHSLRRIQTTYSCIKEVHGTVLDVGCGEGKYCSELIHRGARYYIGVDISKARLSLAKDNNRGMHADFVCCDAGRLPFPSETFDFVLCTETLEHIEDEKAPIKEISRIMKKNASGVFSVPSRTLWGYLYFFVASKLGRPPNKLYREQTHCREYGKWEFNKRLTSLQHLRQLLRDSGLVIVAQKAAWVLDPLPLRRYSDKVLCEPHKYVRMAKALAFIDRLLAKLLRNLGLYTIIAVSKS